MPIELTIDGRAVEVAEGKTVLDAARALGIDIPTLCHLEKCGPLTSCLACVVKLKINGMEKVVPSCATVAQQGMVIESESNDVREARRTAMELLLSDHVGDCLSPCQRLCPLDLNIPQLLRNVQSGAMDAAVSSMRNGLPLPAIITRLCHAPCENGCRRGTADEAVAIREVECFIADEVLKSLDPQTPTPATGKSVVIVGSGPTGLTAAFFLRQRGHVCTVVDRNSTAGGTLCKVEKDSLAADVLGKEIEHLRKLGVEFRLGLEVGTALNIDGLLRGFDVVLLAPGHQPVDELTRLTVETTATGIKINPDTFQTSIENVFAAGAVVKPIKQIVKAMSDGMAVANRIHQFLLEGTIRKPDKTFSSIMGRLEKRELTLFVQQASAAPRHRPDSMKAGFTSAEASAEAERCVHCDCRAAGDCKLQHYAAIYRADPGRFRDQRRSFEQQLQHADVIYEPGKCIRCGICVRLTEQNSEPLGLTYIGRGFDVQIAAPLNSTMADGLKQTAAECVESCPTGALVRRKVP